MVVSTVVLVVGCAALEVVVAIGRPDRPEQATSTTATTIITIGPRLID